MIFKLCILSCIGLCLGKVPFGTLPRNSVHYDNFDEKYSKPSQMNSGLNLGLQGVVTKDDWDRVTIKDATPPKVCVDVMKVCFEGKTLLSLYNRNPIYCFQGIRYGQAPVGKLRFKPTRRYHYYKDSPETESKTELADEIGNMCIQNGMLNHDLSGDEDCLFLNVYTPKMPEEVTEKLPVMLFIHGGAFTGGDASLYLPTKLLDHEVILITIHYRLGAFGFYFLNNEEAPGNAALYDQIASLEWVQDYIESFGGDKNRVTVFGESAGSVSTNYMMILPRTKGLLHNAISESGSVLEHWSLEEEPLGGSFHLGEECGCIEKEEEPQPENEAWMTELGNCMSTQASAADLNRAMNELVSTDRYNGMMGFRGCSPVIQSETLTDAIITKHPVELYKEATDRKVNFMIGANKNEGSFVVGIMYAAYLSPHNLTDDPVFLREEMIPTVMGAFGVVDETHGLSESLIDKYLPGIDLAVFEDMAPGMIDLVGVMFLKAGGWESAKMHSYHMEGNTFFYSFDFLSDDSMFYWLIGAGYPFPAGVTHSDELMYLFAMPAVLEDQQIIVSKRMTKMWTNFAKYGHPTPDEDDSWKTEELNLPKWKQLLFDDHNYMLMNDEFNVLNEYPDRWTISIDEQKPPLTTPYAPTTENNDDLEKERDAYMISMIVFITMFVVSCGIIVYLFMKKR